MPVHPTHTSHMLLPHTSHTSTHHTCCSLTPHTPPHITHPTQMSCNQPGCPSLRSEALILTDNEAERDRWVATLEELQKAAKQSSNQMVSGYGLKTWLHPISHPLRMPCTAVVRCTPPNNWRYSSTSRVQPSLTQVQYSTVEYTERCAHTGRWWWLVLTISIVTTC